MTSAPTVSVITISFKDLDGLKRTVESVRAQRYVGRIGHIVIDGGSGDVGCHVSASMSMNQVRYPVHTAACATAMKVNNGMSR